MTDTKRGSITVSAALCGAVLFGAMISAQSAAADGLGDAGGQIAGAGACALGTEQLGSWMKTAGEGRLPAALRVFTVAAAGTACALAVKQFEAKKPATFQFENTRGQKVMKTLYFNDLVNPPTLPVIDLRQYSPYWRGGRCEGLPIGSFYDICVGG